MDTTRVAMLQSIDVMPDFNGTLGVIGQGTYRMSSDMNAMVGDIGKMRTDVSVCQEILKPWTGVSAG